MKSAKGIFLAESDFPMHPNTGFRDAQILRRNLEALEARFKSISVCDAVWVIIRPA
jgi:hypothetical protein